MSKTIVHGLSIFPDENGVCRIRATLRAGELHLGQIFTYTTPEGKSFNLALKECRDNPTRHLSLILEGEQEAIANFKGGYYLFSDS